MVYTTYLSIYNDLYEYVVYLYVKTRNINQEWYLGVNQKTQQNTMVIPFRSGFSLLVFCG